jgi:restriction endonuclease S subunit
LFIDYGPWLWNPRKKEVFECPEKILVRQVGKFPICAYDNEQFYTLNTIYNIIIKDKSFDTKYVLAVLNSKLMQNIWKEIYPEQKDVFPRLKKEQLVEIPIPIVSFEQQKQITKIVDQILVEKKKNPNADTSALEREADQKVYELYGLSPEEIAVIIKN